MTLDQILLFALFAAILAMLVWGRFRHDLVAAAGLFIAVALGLVPQDAAFSGFSNPAVVVVALVLIASRAFENSGVLGVVAQWAVDDKRPIGIHIALVGGIAAALSAVINNVAALALLMPMDIQAARKAGRPPGMTLMALSFATILGGMTTLIGTPPNIIASSIRAEQLGQPYRMFDFAPVGIAVAVAGVIFVALIGWRLVPRRGDSAADLASESSFEAELEVGKESPAVGKLVAEFEDDAENADVLITGLIRDGALRRSGARLYTIEPDDLLVVRGSGDAIAAFIKATNLQEAPSAEGEEHEAPARKRSDAGNDGDAKERSGGSAIVEVVVRADSYLVGQSAASLRLRKRFGLTLLGISHAGKLAREKIGDRLIEAGDVLLLAGPGAASTATLNSMRLLPVNTINVAPYRAWKVALTVGLFVAAIAAASFGLLSFTVAIAMAVVAYAAFGLVPARDFYSTIEWPVVVMLACLLPIGAAFDRVGGTALVAGWIGEITQGYSPIVALIALMVATMALSDVLNNVATIVVAGPIAIDLAHRVGGNPDTFLMAVTIASSCAFLTPIGHKNNTLIMGPGGFRFSDYWRMGLPLELVVLVVAVPMLLIVWPI